MPEPKDSDQQRELNIHRRNLAHLEQRAARYGGEVNAPLDLFSDLHDTREAIERLEADITAERITYTTIDTPVQEGDLSDTFAPSVSDYMAQLNRKVERLTNDQFRVIQMLSGEKRVRISGCAGSGKTLVAAEKAIRLS